MKSAVELNKLLLKSVLLCQGIFRKVLVKAMQNSTFRDNLGEQKVIETASGFQRLLNEKFDKHSATFGIYWVYYKPPILSYLKVGRYATSSK